MRWVVMQGAVAWATSVDLGGGWRGLAKRPCFYSLIANEIPVSLTPRFLSFFVSYKTWFELRCVEFF
jgi:hypothetical protein